MTRFPSHWRHARLGEVLDRIEAGKSFAGEPRPAAAGEWGIIKVSAMTYGTFHENENKAVPSGTRISEAAEICPGDLLLSRANTRDYVGASVLVGDCRPRLLLSDKSLRLHSTSDVDRRWLWYALNVPSARKYLSEASTGVKSGMRNISQHALRAMPLLVPPLDEQKRIVGILEDHLSHLDAARSALNRSQSRLGRLRQAMLASVLNSAALAEGIEVHSVGEVAVVGTGATPLKARRDYYEGGTIPWVTSADLAQGLIEKPTQFVTPKALAETNVKPFPPGTLLVAMYGEGKTRGTVGELAVEATTNQACAAIQLHDSDPLHRAWVRLALEANYWNMRRLASGGVQPNLNLSLVRQIRIAFPEASIRNSLLRARDTQERARRSLEAELRLIEQRERSLRKALLDAAFTGRLTGLPTAAGVIEEMAGV